MCLLLFFLDCQRFFLTNYQDRSAKLISKCNEKGFLFIVDWLHVRY